MTDNHFVEKSNDRLRATEAGRTYLESIVTDPDGPVYSFTAAANPIMVAAGMARLSRSADDMRIIMLSEFATTDGAEAEQLLKRVVTQFGDDSVQQLVGIPIVVEGASNLLTKQLEWGRLASYLEQSTRYIYFDRPDEQGKYRFFTPPHLPPKITEQYNSTMTAIFERYSSMVRQLTEYVRAQQPAPADKSSRIAWQGATRAQACDAIRAVLPVATKSTVGIFGSAQAIDNLIMHLLSQPLGEARTVGRAIYEQAAKVIPAFLERTMRDDRGLATVAYRANTRSGLKEIAAQLGEDSGLTDASSVKLLEYFPRNERDLAAEMLYASSHLPLQEIRRQIAYWSDLELQKVMAAYFGERLNRRHKPGRATEIAHFEWEILGDYGTFRDLQRHRIVDAFEWQNLTPEYGYEIPELVQEAGLTSAFTECFRLSQELFAAMNIGGLEIEAQYATLLGHRMRYRFMANARELFHLIELRTQPSGHPGYRKICQEMFSLFSKAYPITATAMRFVNQGEDEALTRLAAETATQYKLNQLGS